MVRPEVPKVSFGIRLPVAGPLASPQAITVAARTAEALGFDVIWVYDHIVWSREQDKTHISVGSIDAVEAAIESGAHNPNFYECITTMAFLSAVTDTVKIGVAVLCLPTRHPVLVAKQLSTLDVLSGGRLIVGVGAGSLKRTGSLDFEVMGVSRTEKYERTHEYTDILRTIWTEASPTYEGEYLSFPQVEAYPKPIQVPYPPLWIAANYDPSKVTRGMEIVAEFGDGWFLGGSTTPDLVPAASSEIQKQAELKGRAGVDLTLAVEMSACIAQTSDEAKRVSQRTLEASVGHFSGRDTLEDAIDSTFVGSPEEVRDRVAAFVDGGVRHFELKFIYASIDHLMDQMALWSEQVSPAFRQDGA